MRNKKLLFFDAADSENVCFQTASTFLSLMVQYYFSILPLT